MANNTSDKSELLRILDILFVPSSLLRYVIKKDLQGKAFPKPENKEQQIRNYQARIITYFSVAMFETARIATYISGIEALIDKLK